MKKDEQFVKPTFGGVEFVQTGVSHHEAEAASKAYDAWYSSLCLQWPDTDNTKRDSFFGFYINLPGEEQIGSANLGAREIFPAYSREYAVFEILDLLLESILNDPSIFNEISLVPVKRPEGSFFVKDADNVVHEIDTINYQAID